MIGVSAVHEAPVHDELPRRRRFSEPEQGKGVRLAEGPQRCPGGGRRGKGGLSNHRAQSARKVEGRSRPARVSVKRSPQPC